MKRKIYLAALLAITAAAAAGCKKKHDEIKPPVPLAETGQDSSNSQDAGISRTAVSSDNAEYNYQEPEVTETDLFKGSALVPYSPDKEITSIALYSDMEGSRTISFFADLDEKTAYDSVVGTIELTDEHIAMLKDIPDKYALDTWELASSKDNFLPDNGFAVIIGYRGGEGSIYNYEKDSLEEIPGYYDLLLDDLSMIEREQETALSGIASMIAAGTDITYEAGLQIAASLRDTLPQDKIYTKALSFDNERGSGIRFLTVNEGFNVYLDAAGTVLAVENAKSGEILYKQPEYTGAAPEDAKKNSESTDL